MGMISKLIKLFMPENETALDTTSEVENAEVAVEETVEEVASAPEVDAVVEEPKAVDPAPEVELGREAGNRETI